MLQTWTYDIACVLNSLYNNCVLLPIQQPLTDRYWLWHPLSDPKRTQSLWTCTQYLSFFCSYRNAHVIHPHILKKNNKTKQKQTHLQSPDYKILAENSCLTCKLGMAAPPVLYNPEVLLIKGRLPALQGFPHSTPLHPGEHTAGLLGVQGTLWGVTSCHQLLWNGSGRLCNCANFQAVLAQRWEVWQERGHPGLWCQLLKWARAPIPRLEVHSSLYYT